MSLQTVRRHIEDSPMRAMQSVVVALCVAVNLLDGFDILALSLISPTLSRQWHLTPGALGMLFSAGLLGTAVGGSHYHRWRMCWAVALRSSSTSY